MKYWLKAWKAYLVALALGSAFILATPMAQAASGSDLTISVNSWVGWGPLFIAQKEGFFGPNHINLKFIEDAGVRRLSMITGDVDGYASSVDNLAIDATFGVRGKTVLCFDESAGADGIVAKSNITWANLKGQTVAVQQGLPGEFLLLTVLKQHGLKPTDVHMLDLDGDKAGAAFLSGSVNVAVTWEPWISKAIAMSGARKLITTRELPGLIVDTLVIRDRSLTEKRTAVASLVSGWFKALKWYAQNPAAGDAVIATAYNLKPAEVHSLVSGIRFYDQKKNVEFLGTPGRPGKFVQVFDNASSLWRAAGVTKTTFDGRQFVDPAFVQ